ncbi:30S ribosomal protein S9 [Candidatus Peregrinibacteria bacterium]|nr:30S ribosomal protein S9 [Candidatus Peregrinibacteria bacterium]
MPQTKKTISSKKEKPVAQKAPKGKYFYANGKRKTSVARVKLYKGTGEITINTKPVNKYITVKSLIGLIKSPFKITGTTQKYDVIANVEGGGGSSQAEAIRHGISKALVEAEPLSKPTLKKAGLLTRDARVKERKKYGLKRARKGSQFSKR